MSFEGRGQPYSRAQTQDVKHGRKGVPFSRRRRNHGGVNYIFQCATPTCSNVKEVSGARNLPDHVVCEKAEKDGWVGQGHLQPGVPAYYYCPFCEHARQVRKKQDSGEVANAAAPKSVQEVNVVDQLPRVNVVLRVSSSNRGKSRNLYVRLPAEIYDQMGRPTYAAFNVNDGKVVINLNPTDDKRVKIVPEKTGYGAKITMGSSKLPFKIPAVGDKITASFFINRQTSRLISTTTYEGLYNRLQQSVHGVEPSEVEAEEVAAEPEVVEARPGSTTADEVTATESTTSVPAPPSVGGLSVDDGAALKEMMNSWLDELERQGFNAELEVEDNRIKRVKISRDI